MKTILTLSLCLVLARAGFGQELPPPPKPDTIIEILIVCTICIAGVYVVVKVSSAIPNQTVPVKIALDRAPEPKGPWTPIFTNTVILNGTQPIDFFEDFMTNRASYYRTRLVK